MRILQFVCDGAPGGGTTHVLQVIGGFAKKHDLRLLTQADSYLPSQAQSLGIPVECGDFMSSRFNRDAVNRLRDVIDEFKPDLVHCHGGRAAFFFTFAKSNVPSVYTVHGYHYKQKSFVARTFGRYSERWTGRRINSVVFVSEYDQRLARNDKLVPAATHQTVIYNGIQPPEINPDNIDRRSEIGFVGRLVFQKHPELFVETMKLLPHCKAAIAGGGPLESDVNALIEKYELQDRIRMLGSLTHEQSLEFIASIDALVMTPRWEGLPILPLEAMWLGVPVVGTSVGGVPEIIHHQETGLLAGESAEQLAEQIARLTDDADLRKTIIDGAKKRVAEVFSEGAMLAKLERVYHETANS